MKYDYNNGVSLAKAGCQYSIKHHLDVEADYQEFAKKEISVFKDLFYEQFSAARRSSVERQAQNPSLVNDKAFSSTTNLNILLHKGF